MEIRGIKLIWQDYLIASAFAMNAAARMITNFVVSSISHLSQVASNIEANPTAKLASLNVYITFIEFAVIAGFMLAYYMRLRRQRDKDEPWSFAFNAFTLIFFVMLLFDFLNDASILLGVIFNG